MPFTNEIAGAQGAISRPQFKSPNYVAGVSGWALFRDGSSEFASGQFRGAVLIGTSPNPRVSITTTIPTVLANFSADFTWTAAIIEYFDATQFYFEALGTFTGTGGPYPIRALGAYDTTNGVQLHQINSGPGSGLVTSVLYGSATYNTQPIDWDYRNGAVRVSPTCELIVQCDTPVLNNEDFRHGRGTLAVAYYTGGTGATSAGATEAALPAWTAANSVRIQDAHFYSFHCHGGVFSSVNAFGELCLIRVRKTVNSTASQVLGLHKQLIYSNASVGTFDFTFYVKNATGADIDITPGITIARSAGTGNHSIYGDTASPIPMFIRIKDEGIANDTQMTNLATALV